MRIASLGSGSHGNGTVIDDGKTCLLIDAGANIEAEGFDRLRPLHLAMGMYPYNFNFLIQAGADVNAPTAAHWTPLMLANDRATKALIKAGANPKDTRSDRLSY